MAYLRDITVKCHCGKPATVELRTTRNEVIDQYCRKHGEEARKRQESYESQEQGR